MKREYKGFVAGLLVAGVIAGTIGTAGAVVGRTQAALDYNNIKISLNGQTITPKDANGNTVEPFARDQWNHLSAGAGRGRGAGVGRRLGWGDWNCHIGWDTRGVKPRRCTLYLGTCIEGESI